MTAEECHEFIVGVLDDWRRSTGAVGDSKVISDPQTLIEGNLYAESVGAMEDIDALRDILQSRRRNPDLQRSVYLTLFGAGESGDFWRLHRDQGDRSMVQPDPNPESSGRRTESSSLAPIADEAVALLETLASAAVTAALIVTFSFQVARVEGQSMAPTLADRDRLIVNKAYLPWIGQPQVGDVVMLYFPNQPERRRSSSA